MGAPKLADDLGIEKKEAQKYLDMWAKTYSKASAWMDWTVEEVKKTGVLRYSLGRERPLPTIFSDDKGIYSSACRQAVNTACQGTGADCTSTAIIRIGRRLRQEIGVENARIILEIHDQIITEQKKEYADQVKAIVVEEMQRQMPFLGTEIPLVAEYDEVADLGQNLE